MTKNSKKAINKVAFTHTPAGCDGKKRGTKALEIVDSQIKSIRNSLNYQICDHCGRTFSKSVKTGVPVSYTREMSLELPIDFKGLMYKVLKVEVLSLGQERY